MRRVGNEGHARGSPSQVEADVVDVARRQSYVLLEKNSLYDAIRLQVDADKLRSSGLQSALSDVTSATQEVRALSRDIDAMLDAVAEVKGLS